MEKEFAAATSTPKLNPRSKIFYHCRTSTNHGSLGLRDQFFLKWKTLANCFFLPPQVLGLPGILFTKNEILVDFTFLWHHHLLQKSSSCGPSKLNCRELHPSSQCKHLEHHVKQSDSCLILITSDMHPIGMTKILCNCCRWTVSVTCLLVLFLTLSGLWCGCVHSLGNQQQLTSTTSSAPSLIALIFF